MTPGSSIKAMTRIGPLHLGHCNEPFAGLDPISLNQIANLIRTLNDALGVTSIVVTYDVAESLKIVDYAYFIADGVVNRGGSVEEVKASRDPFVRQFVDSLPDGPVPFHYPSWPYERDLRLGALSRGER